ncbi:hypothetical protein EVAR_62777_1 [Eumeta japonica]|uniref:Uncharacterized protein n=1 Tax=Eumeta variegata TaxID=151549 RepID=A0A4C1Z0U4_EUMVA|nr:hypothetical protein EVAR_62777_1 [Eumeta japonica]
MREEGSLYSQRFSRRKEAVDTFKMHVLEIPQSEWKKCYKNGFSVCKSASIIMNQRGCEYVGFILSERLSECANRYDCENPKILRLRVKIVSTQIFILSIYTPDMFNPLVEQKEFWAIMRDKLV